MIAAVKRHMSRILLKRYLTVFFESDTAEVSYRQIEIRGTMMSDEEPELAGLEGLEELTDRLKYLMDLMFVRNNIPTDPPVEIEYSYTRTEISVKGERGDLEQISQLMNKNEEISEQVKRVNDFFEDFLAGYDAYLDNRAVQSEYPYLFDEEGKPQKPAMSYGETITYFRRETNVYTYSADEAPKYNISEA